MSAAERYVVRYWTEARSGGYLGGRDQYHCAQWRCSRREALRFASPDDARAFVTRETAETGVDYEPFRIVRLISRAEADGRMRVKTLLAIRNEVYGLKRLDDEADRPASISNPYQAALADVLNKLQDVGGDEYERAQR